MNHKAEDHLNIPELQQLASEARKDYKENNLAFIMHTVS